MLVSTIENNDYGIIDLQVKSILSEMNEVEESRQVHADLMMDEENTNEKKNLSNGLVFNEGCDSFLNHSKLNNQSFFVQPNCENGDEENYVDDSSKSTEIKESTGNLPKELKQDINEGNDPVKMDLKNECSLPGNDGVYPTPCGPVADGSPEVKSIQDCGSIGTGLDDSGDSCLDSVNNKKVNSNPVIPTTSRNISKESKMRISTDDDTNFDIFDFMKCSDDEVTDCSKAYCDKDDLALNEDLVNKYEKNLGLDIVKDKDICWAAGNFDSEMCPLKNYDICNENSMLNFSRESPDDENQENFSQEWGFDENIDCISQEQVPQPYIIVPKKTVDITKIKGWRKKQFTVEKCLANRNSLLKKVNVKLETPEKDSQQDLESGMTTDGTVGEEQNKDYAFVCDKLDDFLNEEAELKINYEIPHLYAEYGIKLTSEELVSRPKFKLSTVGNRLPVRSVSQNILPQKPANVPFDCSESTGTEETQLSGTSLIMKPNQKTKCAFPNKSHKNWSLWKENNLSKGKPMSLLKKELSVKRENRGDVGLPCRRSCRISQAALGKPNAVVNPAVNEQTIQWRDRFKVEAADDRKPATTGGIPISDFGTEYNFQIRKFGVVLYPGPSAPLNPFITSHLQKIRSYRTLIDKRWANFAVSAVVQKGKTDSRKRMILPVTCCFKYKNETSEVQLEENDCKVEDEPVSTNSAGSEDCTSDVKANVNDSEFADGRKGRLVRRNSGHGNNKKEMLGNSKVGKGRKISGKRRSSLNRLSTDSALSRKINDGKFDLYEEEIKCKEDMKGDIDMVNVNTNDNGVNHLKSFSDDSDFYSKKCDIIFEKRKQKTSISNCIKENSKNSPEVIDIEDDDTELSSTVHLSRDAGQNAFNKVIAKLLTKKLNELKQTESLTSSIDNLKTVKFNGLELIKLNFIKENYLSGYINLWYMKMPDTGKSRVFLTFSLSPPLEGAINLKMMSRCAESDPPNIIQEIITKDKVFDSNDFAILYCDGKHWEIHGSVNFEMGKNYSEVEESDKVQVFHLTKKVFPELEMLHDIKQKSDKNKVLKWWVMHMMQDYTEITVRCGEKVGRISRSIIIKTWKTKVPSFIEFKGLDNVRPIGVGVNPRLWPYFLIGPYHMGDHHNLTLKLNSKIVPFEYYLPLDRVKPAFLLKRFVSSVIMHSWRNCRQVVGMWLYDRIAMKQSSFIQVRTRVKKSGSYEPSIEHDYSLSKPPVGLFESKVEHNQKPKVSGTKKFQSTRRVFLVSDVPHLGYVEGELHPDGSITIQHPLKPDRKRNSQRIGDWLNRIMRKRIKFYPSDFYVKWKVVKKAESIQNLEPLDRSYFGGTHILCKKGIFYLLSLTREKIAKLGLDETVVMDAILNNPIIQEVVEVKELGKILLKKDSCDLSMSEVLQMALYEIERLEKEAVSLRKSRITVEEERAFLCRKFLEALDRCEMDENSKRTIDFYVAGILEGSKTNGEEIPDRKKEKENFRRLEAINRFLQSLQLSTSKKNSKVTEGYVKTTKKTEETPEGKIARKTPPRDETGENTIGGEKFEPDNEKVRELESKIKTLHENLSKISGEDGSLREMLTERLNAMSQHLEKMKRSHNTNGKLSPVIGGITCAVAERLECQGSLPSNDNTKKKTKSIRVRKGTVEFDASSSDLVRFQDKGGCPEFTGKLNEEEENNNESGQNANKVNAMVPVTEKKPALVKITSPNLSFLPKMYGKERQSADDNHRSLLNKRKGMGSNFGGIMFEGITLEHSQAQRETLNENTRCNGSENVPGSTTANNNNQHEAHEKVKKDGSKVEEIRRGRRVLVIDDMHLKRLKNSFKHSEGKIFGSMGKRVRLKLLKPSSVADGKASEKFNGRIEYLDGKQVLIVNNKRKRDGYNDFLKKLRTS